MLRVGLLFCAFSFISCSEITSETAVDIVNKSIEAHGGDRTFQELEAISFAKTTRLYREDGSLESETVQEQSFTLIPNYLFESHWMDGNDQHQITYNRNTVSKRVNNANIADQEAIESTLKLALSAEYVFFQPFKLQDNKGQLSYDGKYMMGDSIETSIVAVRYENDTPSSDSWRYYFDENYRLLAASVKHNNRISFIDNLEFQTYKGILFNKVRKSYFVDSLFQNKQLRAAYHYDIIETRP